MHPALIWLLIASASFVGSHFLLSHPLRARLVGMVGEKGFLGLYSLVAFVILGWMVFAFRAVPADLGGLAGAVGDLSWLAASLLTLVALVLLLGSFRGNPAMPDTPADTIAQAKVHGVFAVTRHPMMWSIALWAAAHMLILWSTRTLIVAAAMLILALVGAHLQDLKKEALLGEAWKHWEAQTSYWPRWGKLFGVGWMLWAVAIVLWLAATYGHIHAAGAPAGIWRWIG